MNKSRPIAGGKFKLKPGDCILVNDLSKEEIKDKMIKIYGINPFAETETREEIKPGEFAPVTAFEKEIELEIKHAENLNKITRGIDGTK